MTRNGAGSRFGQPVAGTYRSGEWGEFGAPGLGAPVQRGPSGRLTLRPGHPDAC